MDLELTDTSGFTWPTAEAAPARKRWRMPVPASAVRVLIVMVLYGVAVFAIHSLASAFSTHAVASSSTGMCHRR